VKPAGWVLMGALLGGAWAVPGAGAPAAGAGPLPIPPPPPLAGVSAPPAPVSAASATAPVPPAVPEGEHALRDPFWPVGFTPGPTNTAAILSAATNDAHRAHVPAVDAQALARSLIQVQGFVRRGAQSYVLINGRMTGVGDIIHIQTQGATWRFVVRRIADRDVTIELLP